MPRNKKDHDDLRKLVCAVCWGESGYKASRGVSKTEEAAIKEFVVSSYSKADPSFPAGLCSGCHFILRDWSAGVEDPRPLPVAERYQVDIPITTRSTAKCTCNMCHLASLNGGEWMTFVASKKGSKTPFYKNQDRLCPKCFSRIYRGSKHSAEACKSRTLPVENLSGVKSQIMQKVVHGHLVAAVAESGDQTIKLTSASGGKAMSVTVGNTPQQHESNPLSPQDILAIQNEANLSDR